jgi:hypothetical protein
VVDWQNGRFLLETNQILPTTAKTNEPLEEALESLHFALDSLVFLVRVELLQIVRVECGQKHGQNHVQYHEIAKYGYGIKDHGAKGTGHEPALALWLNAFTVECAEHHQNGMWHILKVPALK